MTTTSYRLITVFILFIIVRLIAMIYFPLQDTTEARYAEIARIMAESGDWITPYFDYNIPFWGKPPLVFWLEALSFKLFGINDFAPRFPSLVATLATSGLIYYYVMRIKNQQSALWASMIFMSMFLVFLLSGVVTLDPIFTFTTTLSYIAFLMVLKTREKIWGYLFFVGLGLGLLTKGPLIFVLVAGTIGLWLLFAKARWRVFTYYPWIGGITLMSLIALPWYMLAELKTPGFLDYFIIGEHFHRFLDAGWQGDKYGTAHEEVRGYTLGAWVVVSLPWGVTALAILLKTAWNNSFSRQFFGTLFNEENSFYILWGAFTVLFFSLSANVLAIYVLPGLPALAIILALYLPSRVEKMRDTLQRLVIYGTLIQPTVIMIILVVVAFNPNKVRTEKLLIEKYQEVAHDNEPLYYLNALQFSARHYSKGTVKVSSFYELKAFENKPYFLAVSHSNLVVLEWVKTSKGEKIFSNKRYQLYKIGDP